jgi:hypothetical protein
LSANILARLLTIILGCAGVVWGAVMVPGLWRDSQINDLASRLILGAAFPPQQLADQIPRLDAIETDPICHARALHSDSIVRLRILEDSLNVDDFAHLDRNIAAAGSAITKSLSCNPTDSYLWLSLFWINSLSRGFRPDDLALLRMSYDTGPNEGWIMVKRNRLALAIFPSLPPDLAQRTLAEFAELLQPEFVGHAADIFIGPGWPIRAQLLDRIKGAPDFERRAFARILEEKGYRVDVPGIEHRKLPGY